MTDQQAVVEIKSIRKIQDQLAKRIRKLEKPVAGNATIPFPAQGAIIRGNPGWTTYAHPGADGYAFTTTTAPNNVVWTQNPVWTGDHAWDDGAGNSPEIQLIGGTNDDTVRIFLRDDAVVGDSDLIVRLVDDAGDSGMVIQNVSAVDIISIYSDGDIVVRDNIVDALTLEDAGGLEYVRLITTDAQPVVVWNEGGVDLDQRWEGSGVTHALFIQGINGRVGVNISIPLAQLDVDQSSGAGAVPVLKLDQGDISEQCVQFSSDAVDRDINLWTIEVTGGGTVPLLIWDDSEQAYTWNKNHIVGDDIWIGLGSAAGRMIFDSTPATDQVQLADADLYINTTLGIIYTDSVAVGMVLGGDGTRFIPTAASSSYPLPPVAIGDTLIAVNTPPLEWGILTTPGVAGYARVSTVTTEAWSATPIWTGRHTFNAGIELPDAQSIGITGNELLTVNAAANNFTFSGVVSVVVPDGAWVGADADCSWVFDSSNGDVSTQDSVGIGTATPDYPLDVEESAASEVILQRLYNPSTDASAEASLLFEVHTSGNFQAKIKCDRPPATGGSLLRFYTMTGGVSTERMVIADDGDVGIGISSPISTTHIYEDTTNVDATAGLTIEQDGTGDAVAQFRLTGAQRWVVGIDNSDLDEFKIASDTDLNTNARLTITTAGVVALPAYGAGFIQSDGAGVLSSAPIVAGDLPAHTHAGAGQGGTITHAVTTGRTPDDHHFEVHTVSSGGPHAEAGLTMGHVLRASGAAAFSFAAIQGTDLPWFGVATRVAFWSAANILTSDAGLTYIAGTDSLTAGNYFTVDGGEFGIDGNELLTVNAAANTFAFSGIAGVIVEDNDWFGLGAVAGRIEFDNQATDEVNFLACNVGVGTSSPGELLDVYGSEITLRISDSRTGTWDRDDIFGTLEFWSEDAINAPGVQAYIRATHLRDGAGHTFADAGLEFGTRLFSTLATRMVIDNAGDVGIGITDPESRLHLYEAGALSLIIETVDDDQAPNLTFIRSLAGPAVVTDGKRLGAMRAYGWDGDEDVMGGRIAFEVDGNPDDDDMPTRIIFEVTPDGGAAVVEAMRIEQNGYVSVGVAGIATGLFHVDQASTTATIPVMVLDQADLSEEFINFKTTVGAGNPIDTAAIGTYYGKARVSVNGTPKYVALYNS